MRYEREEAVHEILRRHGVTGDSLDEAAMELTAAFKLPERRYEKNDFIWYSEGMGESGHGTIVRRRGAAYAVKPFDYNGAAPASAYTPSVNPNDIMGLSTPQEAMRYFYQRNNICFVKIRLRRAA